jgi:uncharacterized protein (TIGR02452 family)
VRKGYRPLLLNMSDHQTAGGCVKSGSSAQEENLFRRSNYFKSLLQEYYPLKGTDVVFSPQICFFKDNEECHYRNLAAGCMVDCVACPAIRQPGIQQDPETKRFSFTDPAARSLLKEKARMIFKVGYLYGHDVLVLSAHGCGAWGGPTHEIAEIYRELIEEYQGCFRAILFAILGSKMLAGLPVSNLDIFAKTFYGATLEQPEPPYLPPSDEEVEPPPGGEGYQPPVYDPNPLTNGHSAIPTDVHFG